MWIKLRTSEPRLTFPGSYKKECTPMFSFKNFPFFAHFRQPPTIRDGRVIRPSSASHLTSRQKAIIQLFYGEVLTTFLRCGYEIQ